MSVTIESREAPDMSLNHKQRKRAGEIFEKSATGMLVGSALAGPAWSARVLATMFVLAALCFCLAMWIERSRRRGV